jgi:hypothetical protein
VSSTTVVLIIVLVVVVGGAIIAIFGWDRYRGGTRTARGAAPSAAEPTNEVFLDPDTGRRMRVWHDAATGQREYRPDDYPGAPPG